MINPYLNFDGDAAEAVAFYEQVFAAERSICMTFADAPDEMGVPAEHADKIMHVSLPLGSSTLMISDVVPGMGPPLRRGNDVSIAIAPESREHAEQLFAALSAGGEVTMPLADTFWGSYFGMCTDSFGIQWLLDYENAPSGDE